MAKKKSKQAKAHKFSSKARKQIYYRDRAECIFCRVSYRMEKSTWFSREIPSIMHYIPRSKGGLGIPENGAIGCQYHHNMLDNGNEGVREEMLQMFQEYLKTRYPDWSEDKLYYNKWDF